jgi:hypothetical protein
MNEYLTYIIPILTTLLGYVGGNYIRKKDEEALYIKNLNQSLIAYSQVINEMKLRYDEEIKRLTDKVERYEKIIDELKDKIDLLEQQN